MFLQSQFGAEIKSKHKFVIELFAKTSRGVSSTSKGKPGDSRFQVHSVFFYEDD